VHETLRARVRRAAEAAAAARGAGNAGNGGDATAAAAAAPPLPPVAVSAADRDAALAVRGGTLCQSREASAWSGGRATCGARRGRVYFEALPRDEGLVRVGWAAAAAALELGTDGLSWGYGGTGKRSHARAFQDYGPAFGAGDAVGCCLDLERGEVAFTRNGQGLGAAYELPAALRPEGGGGGQGGGGGGGSAAAAAGAAGPAPAPWRCALFPAICLKNAEVELNFGGEGAPPFKHAPPPGFTAIGDAPRAWLVAAESSEAAAEAAAAQAAAPAGGGGGGGNKRKGGGGGGDESRRAPSHDPAAAPLPDRRPLCIVLEPTRDLAEQTAEAFSEFAAHLADPPVAVVSLVGGGGAGGGDGGGGARQQQQRDLLAGCEVAVGTAGRVAELVASGRLAVDQVRFLVLDEADRLCADSAGEIDRIFKRLPKNAASASAAAAADDAAPSSAAASPLLVSRESLQVLLFSATLHSPEVRALALRVCAHPVLVDLRGSDAVPEHVDHLLAAVDPRADRSWLQSSPRVWTDGAHAPDPAPGPDTDTPEGWSEAVKRLKPRVLQRLLDARGPGGGAARALVFCRTNHDCDNLERFLKALAAERPDVPGGQAGDKTYSCLVLAGARTMDERRAALRDFKEGKVRLLICTDVAARGLDVQGLPLVVNMSLPDRAEDYVHRVGRVGRAGALGLAVSLVSEVPEKVWFCAQKGLKPWLEPDAKNTRPTAQGGHTIWQDERALLAAVEARLARPVRALDPDLSLPQEVVARLAAGGGEYGATPAPGDGGDGRVSAALAEARAAQLAAAEAKRAMEQRLASMAQDVEALAALERRAQLSFIGMKRRRFGGGGRGGSGAAAGDGGAATEAMDA